MSSSNPFPSLENNIQLLRTSLNAIYGRTSNIIERRNQAHLSQRQATFEPSKEDLDALEELKTKFHVVCDGLYLNLQNSKKVLEREYHENCKDLIRENKQDDEIIAEKIKIQNGKIVSLGKALELDKFPVQTDSDVKMDES